MTATTFDPVKIASGSLSGGNLVFTSSGSAAGTRTTRCAQGPFYCETTVTTLTGAPQIGLASAVSNVGTQLNAAGASLGYNLADGTVKAGAGSTLLGTAASAVVNQRIDFAVDPANHMIWVRVANGNWNNNVSAVVSTNPALQVGGFDYGSAMVVGQIFLQLYATLSGTVFGSSFTSFVGTAPTGFLSLDTVQYVNARNLSVFDEVMPASAPTFNSPSARAVPAGLDRYQRAFSPAGTITNVSGTTKEAGVAVAGRKVEVYDRNTGDLLGFTVSDGSGNWSIPCLGRPSVRVVGSDPTTFNSMVFDNVVPV